jgi:hypothetical protein
MPRGRSRSGGVGTPSIHDTPLIPAGSSIAEIFQLWANDFIGLAANGGHGSWQKRLLLVQGALSPEHVGNHLIFDDPPAG